MVNRLSMVINLSTNLFQRSCSFGLTLELMSQSKVGNHAFHNTKLFLAKDHTVWGMCYDLFIGSLYLPIQLRETPTPMRETPCKLFVLCEQYQTVALFNPPLNLERGQQEPYSICVVVNRGLTLQILFREANEIRKKCIESKVG